MKTKLFYLTITCILSNTFLSAQDTLAYLGQTPPGNVASLFPTPNLQADENWHWHGVPSFSPDGKEMYFVKYDKNINKHKIWFTKCVDNVWTEPQLAPFSNTNYSDNNPFFKSADTMFFQSHRLSNAFIFRVTRNSGQEWSEPVPIVLSIPSGNEFGLQFSITKNGNIYAELSKNGNSDIYVWELENNQYQNPVKQTAICSTQFDGFPFIDNNERFILFTSDRVENSNAFDIFISFKNSDNAWDEPINLSLGNNIANGFGWSNISTDGSYLFFTKPGEFGFNPYWIDAQFVFEMIPNNPYLGETPPDSIPLRFGPASLQTDNTWSWMGSPTFSPDGKEMYFCKYLYNSDQIKMYFMEDVEGVWTAAQTPAFVGNITTDDPFFFKDNDNLYLKRDVTNNNNFKIYTVKRNANGWDPAQLITLPYNDNLGTVSNFSITNDSTFYFTLHTAQGAYIYKSKLVNGSYAPFEKLPNQINSHNSSSPYVDKEEKYLIFESERPDGYGSSDLYISYKNNEGIWGIPINLGNNINGTSWEYAPKISPDGKYLFFCSKRTGDVNSNAYWVDAQIIEQLNPFSGINKNHSGTSNIGSFLISPNPCNTTTTIFFELDKTATISVDLYNPTGTKVAEIIKNKRYQNGKNEIALDVSNLKSGIYNCLLSTENKKIKSMKLIIINY